MTLSVIAECPIGSEQMRGGCIPTHTSDLLYTALIVAALVVLLAGYLTLHIRWWRQRRKPPADEQADDVSSGEPLDEDERWRRFAQSDDDVRLNRPPR
ncbi:MAG: hypothetical protein QOG34_268 [Frankiaceae bacterium]|jgi:hypothetical protein|nr:hypothetical protein [Frankiaceae bacterium]